MATRERRVQMQPFEVDEGEQLVQNSPSKQHSRLGGQQRWSEPGSSAYMANIPDLFLQCFGGSSSSAFNGLQQKAAAMESRVLEMAESLRREREFRASDLQAFDAQTDLLREEKEHILRDLEDLNATHQGTLQRLHEVQTQAEAQSEEVRRLTTAFDRAETRWQDERQELHANILEVQQSLGTARDNLQDQLDKTCEENRRSWRKREREHEAALDRLESEHKAKLAKMTSEHDNTVQHLQADLRDSEAALQTSTAENKKLLHQLETTRSELTSVRESLAMEKQMLSAVQAERQALGVDLASAQKSLSDVLGKLRDAETAQVELQCQVDDLRSESAELQNSVEAKSQLIDDLQARAEASLAETDGLRSSLEESAQAMAVLTSRLAELESSQRNLQSQHDASLEELETLREEADASKAAIESRDSKIRSLQLECQNLQDRLQESDAVALDLRGKLKEHASTAMSLRDSLADAKTQQQCTQSELVESRELCKRLKGQHEKAEEQCQAAQQEQAQLRSELSKLRNQASDMQVSMTAAEDRCHGLEKQLESVRESEKTLKTEKELLSARLEQTERRTREEASALQERCEELLRDLQASSARLSESESRESKDSKRSGELQNELKARDSKIQDLEAKLKALEEQHSRSRDDDEDLASAYAAEHQAREQAQSRAKMLERQWLDAKETISHQERDLESMASQLEILETELLQIRSISDAPVPGGPMENGKSHAVDTLSTWDDPLEGLEDFSMSDYPQNGTAHLQNGTAVQDTNLEPAQLNAHDTSDASDLGLSGVFRDREEWQSVCAEGLAQGWLIQPDKVLREEVIGKGSFGETYRGLFQDTTVAVKCVRVSREIEAKIFLRELKALARVRHANLMAFKGAVLDPPHTCWLVVEFLSGGTLSDWLYGKDNRGAPKRSLLEKVNMSIGIAKGMLALEATDPPIMHRDLKPTNVLLDDGGNPKISDFGLCREHLEDEAYSYTGETGSYTYMSPEMMRGDMYGPSTDVYSFAILLVEILKQKPPFEDFYLSPVQVAEGVAYQDIRPSLPGGIPAGLRYLVEACWSPEPESRPDFSTITGHLMDIAKSLPTRRGFFS